MNFEEARGLFPGWNPMHGMIKPQHLDKLRLVTDHDLVAYGIDFLELPASVRAEVSGPQGLSGFNLPEVPANFIRMVSRVFPNIAHLHRYPRLLDVDFSEAVVHNHWMWFGSYRKIHLQDGESSMSWLKPQTNYQESSGHFRRVATSTLLMGREWMNSTCPCGPSCLRPDHWQQRSTGVGRGRSPNLNLRIPKRIAE